MEYFKVSDAKKKDWDWDSFLEKLWRSVNGENVQIDTNDSEYVSWKVSLKKLVDTVANAGMGNLILMAEYELATGGRIDAMLFGFSKKNGKPMALAIEMKQWSRNEIEIINEGYTSIVVNGKMGNMQQLILFVSLKDISNI